MDDNGVPFQIGPNVGQIFSVGSEAAIYGVHSLPILEAFGDKIMDNEVHSNQRLPPYRFPWFPAPGPPSDWVVRPRYPSYWSRICGRDLGPKGPKGPKFGLQQTENED